MANVQQRKTGKTVEEVEAALTGRIDNLRFHRLKIEACQNRYFELQKNWDIMDSRQQALDMCTLLADCNRVHEEEKTVLESFLPDTKKDFADLFRGQKFDVWMIFKVTSIIIQAFQNSLYFPYVTIGSDIYCWLDEDTARRLSAYVTAIYLEKWLGGDKESYQTLNGFAECPYRKEYLYTRRQGDYATEGERSAVKRAYQQYIVYNGMRDWQAKKEGTPSADRRVIKKVLGKSKGEKTEGKNQIEIKLVDLLTLSWCEAYKNGGLDILKYLFQNNTIMTRVEDIQRGREDGLAKVCHQYQNYINGIHQLDTSKGAPVENHRRFVASSMILHKMERTYCFHLVGKISERKCKSNDDMNCFSQIAAEIILARYAGTDGCLFLPKWAKEQPQSNTGDSMPDSEKRKTVKKPFVFVNERIDAMNFNAYIDQMFCVIGEKDTEIRNIFHQNQRFLVQDLLTLISALFPPAKQHAWTNEDFYDASVFFREVYPVTETMLTVDFPDIGCGRSSENKEFYNHFRESFTALVADKKSPLSRGRKRYKFVKKKMSLEKRKKTKNKEK